MFTYTLPFKVLVYTTGPRLHLPFLFIIAAAAEREYLAATAALTFAVAAYTHVPRTRADPDDVH